MYIVVKAIKVALIPLLSFRSLLSKSGRAKLLGDSRTQREHEDRLASEQLAGTFWVMEKQLARNHEWSCLNKAHWTPTTKKFWVCGTRVYVVYARAVADGNEDKLAIVLLHGNPSWFFHVEKCG